MNTTNNCWLPWVDTILFKSRPHDNGDIMVVIPTVASDISRFDSCITSVERAMRNFKFHIVVVLCPSTMKKKKFLKKHFGARVEIHSLNASFNYCRSINYGIRQCRPRDRYILFLNDDVIFVKSGDINLLKYTLERNRWACVGPYILYNPDVHDETWPIEKSSARVSKQTREVRTNTPVGGSCVLWDRQWLNRVGLMDEKFGVGWGMDEADMCLRALRLGGRYGRQDAVAIKHLMHASFGTEYTKYTGAPHMRSLRHFYNKYGTEVEEWGRSFHWWPLPGVLVAVIADQRTEVMLEIFKQVEMSMEGLRWIFSIGVLADQADITTLRRYSRNSMADKIKFVTLAQSSNTRNNLGNYITTTVNAMSEFHKQYPAIRIVTTQGQLKPNIVANELWQARDRGLPFFASQEDKKRINIVPSTKIVVSAMKGKSKMIFHINLLPEVCKILNTVSYL